MNKVYKVIWSQVKHCCVVVSEISGTHGKSHSSRKRNIPGGICGLALALSLGLTAPSLAWGAEVHSETQPTNQNNASANQAVNIENKQDTTAQGI